MDNTNDAKKFDVAKEVGLDPSQPSYETDNLKLNLQMMLYVVLGLAEKNPSLTEEIKKLQKEFVQKVKNEQK